MQFKEQHIPALPYAHRRGMNRIIGAVRESCPDAAIQSVQERYEDEDAILVVYVPESAFACVRKATEQVALDLLLEEDIDIAVLVRIGDEGSGTLMHLTKVTVAKI